MSDTPENPPSAHDRAVTELADVLTQAAHGGSNHAVPVDDYVRGEATRVLDAILAAVDERSAEH